MTFKSNNFILKCISQLYINANKYIYIYIHSEEKKGFHIWKLVSATQ